MGKIRLVICIMLAIALQVSASADTVTDWNNVCLSAIKTANLRPTQASRMLAMMHIAIYDAVNGITPTHHYYCTSSRANPASTSANAAVIAAAYTVLVNVMPTMNAKFYRDRQASLSLLPNSRAKSNGISWGTYVGSVISYIRKYDNSNLTGTYNPIYQPGFWRPTPPFYASAVAPMWGKVTPFAVPNMDDFMPAAPPLLASNHYAQDVNEVKLLGELNSPIRTPDQTETAFFWADDVNSVSPPGTWNKVAQSVSHSQGNTLYENAHLFALINISMADACTCAWKCKYTYNLWRPITAIREANSAGNPLVIQDPTWTPLLITPAFPEYVSGHSSFGAAAAEVLARFYGTDNIPFDLHSDVINVTRSFTSFSQAANENGRSRIYAGIHYQFANEEGIAMGRHIGEYVFENEMTPL